VKGSKRAKKNAVTLKKIAALEAKKAKLAMEIVELSSDEEVELESVNASAVVVSTDPPSAAPPCKEPNASGSKSPSLEDIFNELDDIIEDLGQTGGRNTLAPTIEVDEDDNDAEEDTYVEEELTPPATKPVNKPKGTAKRKSVVKKKSDPKPKKPRAPAKKKATCCNHDDLGSYRVVDEAASYLTPEEMEKKKHPVKSCCGRKEDLSEGDKCVGNFVGQKSMQIFYCPSAYDPNHPCVHALCPVCLGRKQEKQEKERVAAGGRRASGRRGGRIRLNGAWVEVLEQL